MKRLLEYLLLIGLYIYSASPLMAENQKSEASVDVDSIKSQITKLIEQNQIDSALFYCDKLISMDSTNTIYHMGKADLLASVGKYEEALVLTKKIIRLDPTDIEAILTQSSIQLAMSRFDDALKTIDEGLVKNPSNSKLNINKAAFFKYKEDTINTIATCKEVLKSKDVEKDTRFQAYSMILDCTPYSSQGDVIETMVKDMGAKDFSTVVFATQTCNVHGLYDKAEKYKKTAFKLRDKQNIDEKIMFIDEYRHGFTIVQAFEYFNPKDAGHMPVQYLFRVYLDNGNGNNEWQYNIRVEYVMDIMGEYKSQMAVMATQSNDGFRTYWDTLSEVKSTPYKKWMAFANQIIDNKLKVGSSAIIGKDKKSTITIGGE